MFSFPFLVFLIGSNTRQPIWHECGGGGHGFSHCAYSTIPPPRRSRAGVSVSAWWNAAPQPPDSCQNRLPCVAPNKNSEARPKTRPGFIILSSPKVCSRYEQILRVSVPKRSKEGGPEPIADPRRGHHACEHSACSRPAAHPTSARYPA